MTDAKTTLLHDARRWLEQEAMWDEMALATEPAKRGTGEPVKGPASEKMISPHPQSSDSPVRLGVAPSVAPNPVKAIALQALYEKYNTCTRCDLGNTRLKFVFGVGDPNAEVMFIGEGPGYEEDHRGEPFVGPAGQLLDKIIESIGLSRTTVYIANIVKCHAMVRPDNPEARGNDRPPNALEVETCSPILQQQIAIIRPRVIVSLGSPATRALLRTTEGITKLRGKLTSLPAGYWTEPSIEDRAALSAIPVLPTYHPSALLRNPDLKKETWSDMKQLRSLLAQN